MRESAFYAIMMAITFMLWNVRIPIVLKIVWGYFLFYSAYLAFWPYYAPPFAPLISNLLGMSAGRSFGMIVLMPLMMLKMSERLKRYLLYFFVAILSWDCVKLILDKAPIFEAMTFDATLLGCYVFVLNPKKWISWILIPLFLYAIVHTTGRNGGMIVAVALFVLMTQWAYKNINTKAFISFYTIGLLSCLGFGLYYWPHFLKDPRATMWVNFLTWWWNHTNVAYGAGIGTFEWVGPYLPSTKIYQNLGIGFFLMHNDWLQILFESGIVGFCCAVTAFVFVALKLRDKDLAIWLSVGAGMVFYYPTHAFPGQYLMLVLAMKAIQPKLLAPVQGDFSSLVSENEASRRIQRQEIRTTPKMVVALKRFFGIEPHLNGIHR